MCPHARPRHLVPGSDHETCQPLVMTQRKICRGGSGPLVVLLHGWPDTPHTWDHQLAALAGAGFRVAAPWLRGYPPTEIPQSGYSDIRTLAVDVRELIGVLGGGDPCLLVGQDWGASIGYQVLAAFPEVVRSAVVMAVPHSAATHESPLRG